MIELNQLTIIIPVKIESADRYHNLWTVLSYLNHHLKTNVKIVEMSNGKSRIDYIGTFDNLNIEHRVEILSEDSPFHRTRYLNEMLFSTDTEVVCNYDADIFLPVKTIVDVVNGIIEDKYDFVYPYRNGIGQRRLFYSGWYANQKAEENSRIIQFINSWDPSCFDNDPRSDHYSAYAGHSLFARTKSYRDAYGENEDFISWGPEDQERVHRFRLLGYRVDWYDGDVYHIEHTRTPDSWYQNPFFQKNDDLFNYIKTLDKEKLNEYYSEIMYLKKYSFQ